MAYSVLHGMTESTARNRNAVGLGILTTGWEAKVKSNFSRSTHEHKVISAKEKSADLETRPSHIS